MNQIPLTGKILQLLNLPFPGPLCNECLECLTPILGPPPGCPDAACFTPDKIATGISGVTIGICVPNFLGPGSASAVDGVLTTPPNLLQTSPNFCRWQAPAATDVFLNTWIGALCVGSPSTSFPFKPVWILEKDALNWTLNAQGPTILFNTVNVFSGGNPAAGIDCSFLAPIANVNVPPFPPPFGPITHTAFSQGGFATFTVCP